MKKLLLALATLAVLSVPMKPAQAVEIDIGLSLDGGATIVNSGNTSTGFFIGGANLGPFQSGFVVAAPPTLPLSHLLNGNTVNLAAAAGAGNLDVYITVSDIPSLAALAGIFTSQFDVVGLTEGWTVEFETLISLTNQLYLGTQLSSALFNQPADAAGPFPVAFAVGAGDFSVTGHFTIFTNNLAGGFNGGVDIAAVPGPVVGAGIPGLVMAFGGLYAFYRRRRQAAAA